MDETATKQLENLVTEFVDAGKVFTSGHLTVAARERGLWLGTKGHMETGAEVRRLWRERDLFEGYDRTDTYQNGVLVFAYHPTNINPLNENLCVEFPRRVDLSQFPDGMPNLDDPNYPDPDEGESELFDLNPDISEYILSRDLYNGGVEAELGDVFAIECNGRGYFQFPRSVTRFLYWEPGNYVEFEGVVSGERVSLVVTNEEKGIARLQPKNGTLRVHSSYFKEEGFTQDLLYCKVDVDSILIFSDPADL